MSARERTRQILAEQRKNEHLNEAKKPWTVWQVSLLCLLVLTVVGIALSRNGSPRKPVDDLARRDAPYSSEYTEATRRAGYSGVEAEQVGAAAESICLRTEKC